MIKIELAYQNIEEIKELFQEYTDMLVQNDSRFAEYLELQNYDSELENLEDKYGLPEGRLYIARVDGKIAGCIGLKKIDDEYCEMKRLYIRPEFRGLGLARMLVEQITSDSCETGYKSILLDTLPFLKSAIHLYKKYGFYEIPAYNDSPMENSIYMRRDLDQNRSE